MDLVERIGGLKRIAAVSDGMTLPGRQLDTSIFASDLPHPVSL
jgi:hypothetical protein